MNIYLGCDYHRIENSQMFTINCGNGKWGVHDQNNIGTMTW